MKTLYNIYRYSDVRSTTGIERITKVYCYNNFIQEFTNNTTYIFDNCSQNLIEEDAIYTTLGNGGSFIKALDIALTKDDSDYIYMIEDDYLHLPGAKKILLEGLTTFDGFITLYDHPDKYDNRKINPLVHIDNGNAGEVTTLYLTQSSHWKITNSTTMTFACSVKNLRRVQHIMRRHSVNRPTDFQMWLDIKKEFNMNVYSPVPGYSTHCEVGYESPLINWMNV